MSISQPPLYDTPIFNSSNFSYTTSTLKMAQPAINNGLIYYQNDGLLHTQSNIVNVSGNIGIGTPSPAYKLDINGNTNILGNEYISGNLGVGTTAPAYKLDVNGNTNILGNEYISGNLGVGTTAPAYKLDVNGNTRISGNIGIGTIPSVYKLNVLGGSILNGDILTTTDSLEYPPQALTALATTITSSSYSNGTYNVIASSTLSTNNVYNAFDKNPSTFWVSVNNLYSTTAPYDAYVGTVTTIYDGSLSYAGEYIQIQLPQGIRLISYSLQATNFGGQQTPKDFAVFGSFDGTTWSLIGSLMVGEIFSQAQIKTYTVDTSYSFNYFRLAINKRQGNQTANYYVDLAEWRLFGVQSTATLCTVYENVGIGTKTPSAKLHIVHSVDTSSSFRVDDQLNDTTPFIIDASGNVGIQTASPNSSAILDITSSSKGLLLPRITTMNNITTPAEGLIVYDSTAKSLAYRNATSWVNLSNVSSPRVAEIYYDSSTANTSTIALADSASFYRIPFSSAPIAKTGSSDFEVIASADYICIKYTGTTTSKLATHYITVSVNLTNDAVSLKMKVYKNPTISLNTLSGTIITSSLQEAYLATNGKFYNIIISFTDAPTNNTIYYVGAQASANSTLNCRSFTWVTTAY